MAQGGTTRMGRAERRETILDAAAAAFARHGVAGASIEEVARAAGISRVVVYRHFESKAQLFRAVVDRSVGRFEDAVGPPDYDGGIVGRLLAAARTDPDGFRVVFERLPREPDFAEEADEHRGEMVARAFEQLVRHVPDPTWARWAADLAPTVTLRAITAWLDAGSPEPELAPLRVERAVAAVVEAARATRSDGGPGEGRR